MANKKIMTKEELQAKHRLEEAQRAKRPYQTLDSGGRCFGESISRGSANGA